MRAREQKKEEEGATSLLTVNTLSIFDLLLTEVEGLNDCAVALDVNLLEVHQQLTTLTYKAQKCALGTEVVLVALEVLSKVADTVREQCDLALRRTGIGVRLAVLTEKLLLFLC